MEDSMETRQTSRDNYIFWSIKSNKSFGELDFSGFSY